MAVLIIILIVAAAVLCVLAVILTGKARADAQLKEMADVFHMPLGARVKYIYLPALHKASRR